MLFSLILIPVMHSSDRQISTRLHPFEILFLTTFRIITALSLQS